MQSECQLWEHIRGTHPQTGEHIDQEGCTLTLQTILMIETASVSRSVAAAIESTRNEFVKAVEHRRAIGE